MKKLMVVLLFLIPMICIAAEPSVDVQNSSSSTSEWVVGDSSFSQDSKILITSILTGVKEFQKNFYSKSQPIGEKIFLILATITLSWTGIQIALSSGESGFGSQFVTLIKLIFLTGFVYYIVQSSGFDLLVRGTLEGLTNELAEIALPAGATIESGFLDYSSAQMSLLGKVWESMTAIDFFNVIKVSFTMILMVVLLVLFVICSVISFVAFLSAILAQSIAFSLAPIFIATLVNEKTSFLFDGWLKFTIAACFTKVIVCILVSVGVFTFDRIITANVAGLMTLFSSVVIGALIAYQMLQAPEIAQSLTSGGSVGFSRMLSRGTRAIGSTFKQQPSTPKPPTPPKPPTTPKGRT